MKELKINDSLTIKYNEGLTENDYVTLIDMSITAYVDGLLGVTDNLRVVSYNPIKCQQVFNRTLFILTIEEYDENQYDILFQHGVHNILLAEIINAKEALDTVKDIIKQGNDISVVIDRFLNGATKILDEKLSSGTDLEKLLKKIPKELSKVMSGYETILGRNIKDKTNKK